MKKEDWWIVALLMVLILSCIGTQAQVKPPVVDTVYLYRDKIPVDSSRDFIGIVKEIGIIVGGVLNLLLPFIVWKITQMHKQFNSRMDNALITKQELGEALAKEKWFAAGVVQGREDEKKETEDKKVMETPHDKTSAFDIVKNYLPAIATIGVGLFAVFGTWKDVGDTKTTLKDLREQVSRQYSTQREMNDKTNKEVDELKLWKAKQEGKEEANKK